MIIMKNTLPYLLYFMVLFLPLNGTGMELSDSTRHVLEEVDAAIVSKTVYQEQRERDILQLRKQLSAKQNPEEQYRLCGDLFGKYLHYQADSAFSYVQQRERLLPELNRAPLQAEVYINMAEVMGVMGMYTESMLDLEEVDSRQLDKKLLAYYYHTSRAFYGWAADYTAHPKAKQLLLERTDAFRDSILSLDNPPTPDREIVLAEKELLKHRTDEAIALLESYRCGEKDLKHKAFLHYTFAEAYSQKGDIDKQTYHLAKSALCDLYQAVREYASLQKLAKLMYDEGDYERAYQYLNCSMEDAVACNARLRFLEVTEFYPIIDRAYQDQLRDKHVLTRNMFISVSVLAFLLIIATGYLYYWMKKLQQMRRHLYETNQQLVSANERLEDAGRIKEVYIARYLDKCVGYLEKQEQYRRSLEKLAMASKIDELFKTIRSEEFLRDERKAFYYEFDKSFLDLFPHFIEDFNELLSEEGKIFLRKNELLNTELRIFALIRLGVTDSNRIAHFLGYSLATVYNYRSKLRNKAVGDKDSFEQRVMRL